MTTNEDVVLGVGLDTTKLEQGIENIGKWLKGSMIHWAAALDVWKQATGALTGVANTMAQFAKAAGEVDVIQRRANATIGDGVDALMQLNVERQRALGIDADEQLKLQTKLKQLGLQNESLNEATKASIGLANVTGQDLATAATTVAKVFEGNVNILGRMGVKVNTVAEAQAKLAEMYKVTEKESGSYLRNLDVVNATLGDSAEAIGALVIQTKQLNAALSETALITSLMNRTLESDGFKGLWNISIDGVVEGFWTSLNTLTFGVSGNLRNLADSLAGIEKNLRAMEADDLGNKALGWAVDPNYRGAFGEGGVPTRTFGADQGTFDMRANPGGRSRGRKTKQGISLSSSDIGTMFDGDGSTRAEATSNADFFANPLFDSSSKTARQVTDDGGEMRDMLAKQYADTQMMGEGLKQLVAGISMTAADGLSNIISGMIQAAISGTESLTSVLGKLVGTMITNIGMLLLQTGTAAVALGALSLIPGLAFITGPPGVGIAAGAAAMAVGAGLVAVGAAMGGGGSGGSGNAPRVSSDPGGRSTPNSYRRSNTIGVTALPAGFSGAVSGGGTVVNNYTVNLGSAAIVGTEAEVGRRLSKLMKRAERLG